MAEQEKFETIDAYIAHFEPEAQEIMQQVRRVIQETAPQSSERISWQMPTFYLYGNLIHFAAHKTHLGIYPGSEAMEVFAEDLKDYKTSKGAVQFPYSKPIPYDLIRKITAYRVETQLKEHEEKGKK